MKLNLIIAEDFYNDPDTVRSFALAQPFDVVGNYPGARTKPFINDAVKIAILKLVETTAGPVTNWHEDCGFTGAFQLCTANDRTWIHADSYNTWAGVLYLTPNAPLSGGTSLYQHKATGNREKVDVDYESYDYTKWEEVDRIGNIYNRLILYRGNMFHASVDYFGSTYEDGRLFQTFFFDTEH